MDTIISQNLLKKIEKIIYRGGEIALEGQKHYGKIFYKKPKSIVTSVDIKLNEFLIAQLQSLLLIPIYSEEEEKPTHLGDRYWLIDPLDGTLDFIKGGDTFSIAVALVDKGSIEIGVIYCPRRSQLFSGIKKVSYYLNGQKIDKRGNISKSIMLNIVNHGFYSSELKQFTKDLKNPQEKVGSLALALSYVALGKLEAVICNFIAAPWDVAAAVVLLESANCVLTDIEGKPWYPLQFMRGVVSSTKDSHQFLLSKIQSYTKRFARHK